MLSVAVMDVKFPVPGVVSPMLTLLIDPVVPEVNVIDPLADTVTVVVSIVVVGAVTVKPAADARLIVLVASTDKSLNVPSNVKLLLMTELASVVVVRTSTLSTLNAPVALRFSMEKLPFSSTRNPTLLKPSSDWN